MEQRSVIRNVAGTALAFGLTFSVAGGSTGTLLIDGNGLSVAKYSEYNTESRFQINSVNQRPLDNIYVQNKPRNLDKVAMEIFGEMRDATQEERDSVDRYIKSISRKTGVNFFDLC